MYHGYAWAVLISLDQLGNALTGGHPDVTVSARLGMAQYSGEGWLMKSLSRLVDFCFAPVESKHCLNAYVGQLEESRQKLRRGTDVGIVALTPVILLLAPALWLVNVARWLGSR